MKIVKAIISFALVAMMLSGCDFLRKIAGRPTSEDIEAKRELIQQQEAKLAAEREKIAAEQEAAQKKITDSLAIIDKVKSLSGKLIGQRKLTNACKRQLTSRYYVVIGTFSQMDNAQKKHKEMLAASYETVVIYYQSGYSSVALYPSDNLMDAYSALIKVRESGLCNEAWILDAE